MMIGNRKAFYRQRILESSFARKETIVINILITSKDGDGKIMQTIIMSESEEVEPLQPVQMSFYQSDTF